MRKILFIIIFCICNLSFLYAKSAYKIVIDPGHSFEDALPSAVEKKVGPVFQIIQNGQAINIFGFKKGTGASTEYTFAAAPPSADWSYVYKSQDEIPENRVGFVEAALNLEVAAELQRLLNVDGVYVFKRFWTPVPFS